MGTLECVRESLRLALDELATEVGEPQRLRFGAGCGALCGQPAYYKASAETLKQKMSQAGKTCWSCDLAGNPTEAWRQGEKVQLLERVWSEQFEVGEDQRSSARPRFRPRQCRTA